MSTRTAAAVVDDPTGEVYGLPTYGWVAYLYRVDLAAAKRPMTPAKVAAVWTAARPARSAAAPAVARTWATSRRSTPAAAAGNCIGLVRAASAHNSEGN
jgi:hypothetical protein